ncbi:MAG: septum formation initiator family protein [Rhodospirillales bacterium]|nr:septum formation initiator family protein [Rhodospirillales bacterium]QQS12660.1 MAG: septum formation initiator family protein [Rhodospirillales bacterium]
MYFRFRSLLTPVAFAMVFAYFGHHLMNGERGVFALITLKKEVERAEATLAETRAARDIWERRVSLLRNQSLDPDMIEERARALLHVAWPDDIVVFTPTR